jgi:hypothetical protein
MSITNGHAIILDMRHAKLEPYIDRLRSLEFVKDVQVEQTRDLPPVHPDGVLKLRTAKNAYRFILETKQSYLDTAMLNAIISHATLAMQSSGTRFLLFARYIPQPSAEKLMDAGINFVDLAGNIHLALDHDYVRTITGKREDHAIADAVLTPARIQFLFLLAAQPESANWTVRRIADSAGISKSNAAKIRNQLIYEKLLKSRKDGCIFEDTKELEDQIVRGYQQILRPKLLIGRFRAQGAAQQSIIEGLTRVLGQAAVDWSLTGAPAAWSLQRYYKGDETPVFVTALTEDLKRELRVLPDRIGPIAFLRSFGPLTRWKKIDGVEISHPWLIFTELMQSQDSRAHEAAVQLKRKFLSAG